MFQTLGNLQLDNRIGLLSIDFTTGRIIKITGRGTIAMTEPGGVKTHRSLVIDIHDMSTTPGGDPCTGYSG